LVGFQSVFAVFSHNHIGEFIFVFDDELTEFVDILRTSLGSQTTPFGESTESRFDRSVNILTSKRNEINRRKAIAGKQRLHPQSKEQHEHRQNQCQER
jgi:hypothetical protein